MEFSEVQAVGEACVDGLLDTLLHSTQSRRSLLQVWATFWPPNWLEIQQFVFN